MMHRHNKKLWLALAIEVVHEISMVEWMMGTGILSAFIIITLRLFGSV